MLTRLPVRLAVFALLAVPILDHPATPANAARIEVIRSAWKQRTGDISALRVTQPVDVSF